MPWCVEVAARIPLDSDLVKLNTVPLGGESQVTVNLKYEMDAAHAPANEPEQQVGLSTGGKCGLWACGGCAFLLAVAIVVSGVLAARWLTGNPEILSKLYGEQTTPQILIQPGGVMRMVSDQWLPMGGVAVWSPDGKCIAVSATPRVSIFGFLRQPPPMVIDPRRQQEASVRWVTENMGPRVVIFDIAAGGERIAYQANAQRMGWPAEVAWFPDGQRLAVVVEHIPMNEEQQEMPPELWVVGTEGNEPRKLAANVQRPQVSPNSRWIACQQPTGKGHETTITVLDAEDGSEVWTCSRRSGHPVWDLGGNILYFRVYEKKAESDSWRKVELPAGKVTSIEMKEVQVSRPTRLTSAQELSVPCYGGSAPDKEERTYRLRVRNFAQAHYYYLTPPLGAEFWPRGVCLGGRYVLVEADKALWVYRLADGKFYQVTDSASLDFLWAELDPAGTRICLVGDLPEEDIFRIFTTGISMPVMILQLDEERILSQPGYAEPVVPSSDRKGAD